MKNQILTCGNTGSIPMHFRHLSALTCPEDIFKDGVVCKLFMAGKIIDRLVISPKSRHSRENGSPETLKKIHRSELPQE